MPRAGTEPTSLAFQASVLTITPPMLPAIITVTHVYQSKRSVQTTNILFLNIPVPLYLTVDRQSFFLPGSGEAEQICLC